MEEKELQNTLKKLTNKALAEEAQNIISGKSLNIDLKSLHAEYNQTVLELAYNTYTGATKELWEQVKGFSILSIEELSEIALSSSNEVLEFINYLNTYKLTYDLNFSVEGFRKALKEVFQDVRTSNYFYNAQLWKMIYVYSNLFNSTGGIPQNILESFEENYESIAQGIAYQLSLIELTNILATKLKEPELRANSLVVDREALITLLNTLKEQYKIEDIQESKELLNLLQDISIDKKELSKLTKGKQLYKHRVNISDFNSSYLHSLRVINTLHKNIAKLFVEQYLEMRTNDRRQRQ